MKYKKYDQFVSGPWYFFIRKITKSNGMYEYHCETYKHDNRKQDRIFTEIGLDGLKPYKEKVVEVRYIYEGDRSVRVQIVTGREE